MYVRAFPTDPPSQSMGTAHPWLHIAQIVARRANAGGVPRSIQSQLSLRCPTQLEHHMCLCRSCACFVLAWPPKASHRSVRGVLGGGGSEACGPLRQATHSPVEPRRQTMTLSHNLELICRSLGPGAQSEFRGRPASLLVRCMCSWSGAVGLANPRHRHLWMPIQRPLSPHLGDAHVGNGLGPDRRWDFVLVQFSLPIQIFALFRSRPQVSGALLLRPGLESPELLAC